METTTDRSVLQGKLIPELQKIAQGMGIEGAQKLRKSGLIDAIVSVGNGSTVARSTERPAAPGGDGAAAADAIDSGISTEVSGARPDAGSATSPAVETQTETEAETQSESETETGQRQGRDDGQPRTEREGRSDRGTRDDDHGSREPATERVDERGPRDGGDRRRQRPSREE